MFIKRIYLHKTAAKLLFFLLLSKYFPAKVIINDKICPFFVRFYRIFCTFATMNRKNEQPLVTFIVSYYNLPVQMLCECIDSILALSLRDAEREIIVVDDGSDVSPINGLMHYGDNIIYVRQKNCGVSVARNTAMRMVSGQYIQIIDGDDHLVPAAYEHCLDIIRYGHDIDVVQFDFTSSTKEQKATFNDQGPVSGSDYMRNRNIRGAVWSCLFRQSVRGGLLFTPGINYSEDEEFTAQLLLRADTVVTTDAKAYYYRRRKTSAVHIVDPQHKEQRLDDTLEVIINLNRIADTLPNNDRLAMQRRVAQLSMDYIYNNIVLMRSRLSLDDCLEALAKEGLFPLPDRNYSQKYKWFRKMTNTRLGRTLLLNTLPYLKRER